MDPEEEDPPREDLLSEDDIRIVAGVEATKLDFDAADKSRVDAAVVVTLRSLISSPFMSRSRSMYWRKTSAFLCDDDTDDVEDDEVRVLDDDDGDFNASMRP